MPAPTISVIIPTHNRARTLERALGSVLAQTRPADEIIVVDDGSDDATKVLLQHYPTIHAIYQENQGVSAARNRGIQAAQSAWIALLDSDDAWLEQKLAVQIELCEQSEALIHCDEIWIRNGVRVNAMKKHAKIGGWIYQHCLPLCAISPSAALIRRELFDQIGYFDESLPACEDYDFWLRLCARHPVTYIDQALVVKYGGHDDQLSRRFWGMDRFRIQALEKMLQSDVLSAADYAATKTMLQQKLNILLQGARKRGKTTAAEQYARRLQQIELSSCS